MGEKEFRQAGIAPRARGDEFLLLGQRLRGTGRAQDVRRLRRAHLERQPIGAGGDGRGGMVPLKRMVVSVGRDRASAKRRVREAA